MSEATPTTPPNGKWRKYSKVAGLVVVSAIAGAAATKAGHRWHHGHYGHFGHGLMGPAEDATDAQERAEFMGKRIARKIGATEEQREKLASIAKTVAKDVFPLREKIRSARKEARELLSQPTIDRDAVERLRSEQVSNMDELSKHLATALTDAAEVLTPEQRKDVAERLAKRKGWRSRWNRD